MAWRAAERNRKKPAHFVSEEDCTYLSALVEKHGVNVKVRPCCDCIGCVMYWVRDVVAAAFSECDAHEKCNRFVFVLVSCCLPVRAARCVAMCCARVHTVELSRAHQAMERDIKCNWQQLSAVRLTSMIGRYRRFRSAPGSGGGAGAGGESDDE